MARKVVNRKVLRDEAEAAERLEDAARKKKKKKAAKRKSRAAAAADMRMRIYWGVFNQTMKRVALYDFTQKKEAQKKAATLGASGKSPHFVQKVKEAIEED